ncbi:MAG: DUF2474 domain-containing protein [Alphaproteobacteria bacterium]|nr:DUF2474 domain-containing protein [Alphaproteobacteria bacterium]
MPGRYRRVAWFLALYLAALLTVAAVTYGLRALLF